MPISMDAFPTVPSVLTKTILMGGRTEFRPLRQTAPKLVRPAPSSPGASPRGRENAPESQTWQMCVGVLRPSSLFVYRTGRGQMEEGKWKRAMSMNEPTFNESSQKWGTTAALRPILHLGSRSMYPPRLYPPGGSTQVYPLYPLVPPCTPLYPPSREQEPVRVHLTSDTW